jgi:septum site-determining protein MinC
MAFVLAPEPPLADWLVELDRQISRSEGFFVGRPVVIDLAGLELVRPELTRLVADLQARDIRIMGLENVDPSLLGPDLPPLLKGGRTTPVLVGDGAPPTAADAPPPIPDTPSPAPAPAASGLVLEEPVRSGQSVIFTGGDVTVIGSVASGAEIVAGGSIHVYGALRGRALAGATGNANARIFCRKIDAELVAIDGFYRTADDIESNLRGRAVQIWLEGDAMRMSALD